MDNMPPPPMLQQQPPPQVLRKRVQPSRFVVVIEHFSKPFLSSSLPSSLPSCHRVDLGGGGDGSAATGAWWQRPGGRRRQHRPSWRRAGTDRSITRRDDDDDECVCLFCSNPILLWAATIRLGIMRPASCLKTGNARSVVRLLCSAIFVPRVDVDVSMLARSLSMCAAGHETKPKRSWPRRPAARTSRSPLYLRFRVTRCFSLKTRVVRRSYLVRPSSQPNCLSGELSVCASLFSLFILLFVVFV
jgi:hypothetical protein